jgi:glycosyltransferase involved in cell wall biosynthesis
MSESQAIDRPRLWWKEMIKRRRVRLFDAALVGGPRHRDYLTQLQMPSDRVAFGYDAVDNAFYRDRAALWRQSSKQSQGLPSARYFLSVCRFASEKNLTRLIDAFSRYREERVVGEPWDLVLCGDGPQAEVIVKRVQESGHAKAIHLPGFLQADDLCRWYAHASALVLPSLSEPWGLVANEAASAGLPLLLSNGAGCAPTFVPDPEGTTGARFDPLNVEEIVHKLTWLTLLPEQKRRAMGQRASEVVNLWGPRRFAQGTLEAIALATRPFHDVKPYTPQEAR